MKKYLVIIGLILSSCTRNEQQTPATLQDEIVEMNWNYAVKDFYLVDDEIEDALVTNLINDTE